MASFGGYWDQFQPHQIQQPALPSGGTAVAPTSEPVAQFPEGQSSGVRLGAAANTPDNYSNGNMTPAPTPAGGTDYRATFDQLFPGSSLSPEQLAANEDKLKAAGFRLLGPNAAGQRSKIELPNGQIVDLIQGAGSGKNIKQWSIDNGGGGAGGAGNLGNFQVGMFTGGGQYPLSSVMGEGLSAPWTTPFNAPDPNSVTNDKALQWQMGRGMEAIQRSAAAKGTLLTGGVLKSLDAFGQGLGSTYYNDVYNRKLGEYKMAHDIFEGNQSNIYNRLFGVAGLGQNAAAQVGNAAGAYGEQAGNTMLGQGNAAAAGSVNQGNIWGNAVGGIGQTVADIYQMNKSGYGRPNQGPMSENPSDPMYTGNGA